MPRDIITFLNSQQGKQGQMMTDDDRSCQIISGTDQHRTVCVEVGIKFPCTEDVTARRCEQWHTMI